jgi:hypothetical protein
MVSVEGVCAEYCVCGTLWNSAALGFNRSVIILKVGLKLWAVLKDPCWLRAVLDSVFDRHPVVE